MIPYRSYAGAQALFGALLAGAGAILLPRTAGAMMVALGSVFLLIGLLLWFIAAGRERLARRLVQDHFAHWRYTAQEWKDHVAHQRTRMRRLAWWGHGLFLAFGVGIGFALGELVAGVLAVVLAQVYVLFTYRNVVSTLDRIGATGECYIGDDGMYLTGQCHAWDGWVKAALSDDARRLTLEFSTGPESHAKVEIPVPEGQEGKARHVAKRWSA